MSRSNRFFTKINKKGRLVIIDKECHIEVFDMTLACEVLNRLDLKLKYYNEVNGEQQSTIQSLNEELKLEQDFASRWQKESEMLAKENEQLKEELNNLKKDETMLYHYYTLARYGGDGV